MDDALISALERKIGEEFVAVALDTNCTKTEDGACVVPGNVREYHLGHLGAGQ